MKTKLVYVLTCSPEGNYIEQAVLATFSARYHNPSAHIVLIVDNKTDDLISSGRDEVLKYISEKIVVPFKEDKTMMYRSRWIKTSVRNLIDGDFLFIDCDTITTRSLEEIDSFGCIVGAVPDSHLVVNEFSKALLSASKVKVEPLGIDLEKEEYYFSSGVLYVKDHPKAYTLYEKWYSIWLEGTRRGVNIDQPSLAKANIESYYLIERIPDRFNCIIYTQPDFAKDASILHFTAFRNPSWLFSDRVLGIIRKEGIADWMAPFILSPVCTYIPFRYTISKMSLWDIIGGIKGLSKAAKAYGRHIDSSFSDMRPSDRWHIKAMDLFKKKLFTLGSAACIIPAWISIKTRHSSNPTPNICAKLE